MTASPHLCSSVTGEDGFAMVACEALVAVGRTNGCIYATLVDELLFRMELMQSKPLEE